MPNKIITKDAVELSTKELRYCYNSSFRSLGDLNEWLYQGRHWEEYAGTKVILVSEDGYFLGWGLRRPDGDVGFWTRREARGKGIGLTMVRTAAKLGDIVVHPHDTASRALFKKAGVYVRKNNYSILDHKLDYLESVRIKYESLGRKTQLSDEREKWDERRLTVLPK